MSKVIVYTRPNGSVSVCYPIISKDDPKGFTEEQALARALKKDIPPEAINVQVVDKSVIPNDRTFRDAWKQDGKSVHVDMPKARNIHMAAIRRKREGALAKLDVAFSRASGRKDSAEADVIEGERQRLRDLPKSFDLEAANTPEELKAMWPDGLEK